MTGILSDPGILSGRGVLSGGGVLSVDTLKPQLLAKGEVGYTFGDYHQIGMFTSGSEWLGADTVTSQWYLNGGAVASANPFVTLDDIQIGDQLYLIETATNSYGTTESKSAVLTVVFDIKLYAPSAYFDASVPSSMLNLAGTPAVPGGTQATGGVATWQDQSGNGNHLTQSTAANRAILSSAANGIVGHPVPNFDGTNDTLSCPSLSGFGSYTIMAFSQVADLTGTKILLSSANLPSAGYVGFGHSSGSRIIYPGASFGSSGGDSQLYPEVWALRYNSTTSTTDFYVNNTLVRSIPGALSIQAAMAFVLGSNGVGGYFKGLVGMLGIYPHALVDQDIHDITLKTFADFDSILISPP